MRQRGFAGITAAKSVRLCNRDQAVQIATQSRLRREKQQTVSDEVIVVKKFL